MAIKSLTLLHSNDIHGDFLPEEQNGIQIGGVPLLSGYLKQIRQQEKNVLYAIAGDMFRGSVIDSEFRGISTMEMTNFLSPDVMTVGNHEVDYGIAHLLFLEKCAKFPIINANLYIKLNHIRLFTPYHIIEIDGMKILFIGILTEDVLSQTRTEELIGSFIDIWEALHEIGVIIDNYKNTHIDCTVLLTHIGIQQDIELAKHLDPDWGIDLIIGGHTHTFMEKPVVINGIPIAHAGAGSHQIGRFDLKINTETKDLESYTWECVPITSETVTKDDEMENLLNTYKSTTDSKYQRIITYLKRPLTHPNRYMETEFGNLICDILQDGASFDVMFIASGSLRTTEVNRVVTYAALKEAYPYDSSIMMLTVTGAQLRTMILHLLRDEALDGDAHAEFNQISSPLRIVYRRSMHYLESLTLNGEEVKDDDLIRIGVTGGFHYDGFTQFFGVPIEEVKANKVPRKVAGSAFDILEEYLISHPNLDSHIDGRITVLD